MSHRRLFALLSVTVLALTSSPFVAHADVAPSQQVRLEQDRPAKGRFKLGYANYQEQTGLCSGSRKYGTYRCEGYAVKRGALATKLMTYRLTENVRGYDYYLLDVDVNNVNPSGSSNYGWASVRIRTISGSLVDSTETKGITAEESKCDSLDLQLSTPWPVVSGTVNLGSVDFCDARARFGRSRKTASTSVYRANMLGRTSHVSAQRWVKVARGARPKFEVTVRTSRDRCTASRDGWCTAYTNGSAAKTWSIGTT